VKQGWVQGHAGESWGRAFRCRVLRLGQRWVRRRRPHRWEGCPTRLCAWSVAFHPCAFR
jgi:hypothetical protein